MKLKTLKTLDEIVDAATMCDITRPNVSGDCRIDHQMNPAKAK